MKVFVPTAPCHNEAQPLRRGLDSLAGKVFGIIDNSKHNFNYLADDLEQLLVSKYGVAKVLRRRKIMAGVPAPDSMVQELAEQCDAVITGVGD